MTRSEYYPDPVPVIKQVENTYDDAAIIKRLDDIEKANKEVQSRLLKLEEDLSQMLRSKKVLR